MSVLNFIVLILIFAIPVVFAIQPMLSRQIELPSEIDSQKDILQRRKQVLYSQIKELELEHGLGLVTDSDFKHIRRGLKREVSVVISQIRKIS